MYNISKIIAACAAAVLAAAAFPQGWVRQSPYPANNDLEAVRFVSPDVGFIGGSERLLMRTTNGGQTWSQPASVVRSPHGGGDPFNHIEFPTATTGYAMGGRYHKTTDGGATWTEISTPGYALDGQFMTAMRGFAWDRRAIFFTDDGGTTWDDPLPDSLSNFVYDADFWSETNALAVGQIGGLSGVFRSTAGGSNWQRISLTDLKFVKFMSEDVVIGAIDSTFYRSDDGGVTWDIVYFDPEQFSQAEVEELTKVSPTVAAAIGFDGRIWMTHNAGLTWTKVKDRVGRWGVGWDIHFPSANVGYAVGRLGLIFKTADGGATWSQISNGAARHMLDIEMRPSGLGLAVGDDGVVLRTENFGSTWTAFQMHDPSRYSHIDELNTIEFINEETIIVGGRQGRIFRSDDAGLTWTQLVEFGGNADVLHTFFLNENVGWAAGILNAPRGFIDKTTDGGQTWTRLVDGDPYPLRLHMFDTQNGLALIQARPLLRTANGFQNVTLEFLPGGPSWQHMTFPEGATGWFGSVSGDLLRSTNGGQTYNPQSLPGFNVLTDFFTDLDAVSGNVAYAATYRETGLGSGLIYRTQNGGNTWTLMPTITTPDSAIGSLLLSVDAHPSGALWATGNAGYIFRYGHTSPQNVSPSSFQPTRGQVVSGGNVQAVAASDDVRMIVRPGITLSPSQSPIEIRFFGTAPLGAFNELKIEVESSASSTSVELRVQAFNFATSEWDNLTTTQSTLNDTTYTAISAPANFVGPGGELRTRVLYRATMPVLGLPWSARIDMVRWTFAP